VAASPNGEAALFHEDRISIYGCLEFPRTFGAWRVTKTGSLAGIPGFACRPKPVSKVKQDLAPRSNQIAEKGKKSGMRVLIAHCLCRERGSALLRAGEITGDWDA
jgi:hypothetical protein